MNFSKDCKLSVNKTEQNAFYNDKKNTSPFSKLLM